VEISDPQNRVKEYPHQLSGGMRQRIMIAMALACEPRVLLADEPTTALDVTIQSQLLDLLDHLKKKMGMSIILVTHDLNVVLGFAERVQVMYAGQIIERGTTEEIAKFSRHPYTWALLQAVPSEYVKPKSKLYSITGTPPDLRLPLEHCPFAARCQYCMKVCKEHMPPEVQLTETQSVRCWLADERAPKVVSPVGGEIR
jgi:oligopeptide transport system ATP-binding protein